MRQVFAFALSIAVLAAAAVAQTMPRTDSRARFTHRLTLYDATGRAINPDDQPAIPYSPRATCGRCHDCSDQTGVAGGWHFNAGTAAPADPGRPGEPWLLTDPRTGTQLPLSNRGWAGTVRPGELKLSPGQMLLAFGRHNPAAVEPAPASQPDGAIRWQAAGRFEIDCMLCHTATGHYDIDERAAQIGRHNFAWAPTAGAGLGAVRGSAKESAPAGGSGDDLSEFDPAASRQPAKTTVLLVYDRAKFDPDNRVFLDITRRPSAERCYVCHSARPADAGQPRWSTDGDVHLAAGLVCTDCHRNDIGHRIVRGYEGEARAPAARSLSCRGCHLGDDASAVPAHLPGRLKAPRAMHRGLPALHLDKLRCTACHAGPWPTDRPGRWQTSMAHGLGLMSKERTDATAPAILAPVFARGTDGKIAPHRAAWPNCYSDAAGIIAPDELARLAGSLPPENAPPAERVRATLAALRQAGRTDVVHIAGGQIASLDSAGQLRTADSALARPYLWSIGHDVRPAGQSLGSGGCTDCHSPSSPFVFAQVVADPPPLGSPTSQPMHVLESVDAGVMRAWAFGFAIRPLFIWTGFGCVALVALALLHSLVGRPGPAVARPGRALLVGLAEVFGLLALLGAGAIGFYAWLAMGELTGWLMFIHCCVGPAFAVCAAAWAILRADRFAGPTPAGPAPRRRAAFILLMAAAGVTIGSIMITMLKSVALADQAWLNAVHRWAAVVLSAGVLGYWFTGQRSTQCSAGTRSHP